MEKDTQNNQNQKEESGNEKNSISETSDGFQVINYDINTASVSTIQSQPVINHTIMGKIDNKDSLMLDVIDLTGGDKQGNQHKKYSPRMASAGIKETKKQIFNPYIRDNSDSEDDTDEDYEFIKQIDAEQQQYLEGSYVKIRDFSVNIRHNNSSRVADSATQPPGKEAATISSMTSDTLGLKPPAAQGNAVVEQQPKEDLSAEISAGMRQGGQIVVADAEAGEVNVDGQVFKGIAQQLQRMSTADIDAQYDINKMADYSDLTLEQKWKQREAQRLAAHGHGSAAHLEPPGAKEAGPVKAAAEEKKEAESLASLFKIKAAEEHFSGVQVDIELIDESATMHDLLKLIEQHIQDQSASDTVKFECQDKKVFTSDLVKMKAMLVMDFVEFEQLEEAFNNAEKKRKTKANMEVQFLAREVPCPQISCRVLDSMMAVMDEQDAPGHQTVRRLTNEDFDKIIKSRKLSKKKADAAEAQAQSERDKFESLPGDDLLMEGFQDADEAMLENQLAGPVKSMSMKKAGSQRERPAGPLVAKGQPKFNQALPGLNFKPPSGQRGMLQRDVNRAKLQNGETVEFMCQTISHGLLFSGQQYRKLTIDLKGRINVYELDQRTEQQMAGSKCICFTVDELRQVIYGRLSDRENYQISFIIECRHTKQFDLDLHQEDLQFEDREQCLELVCIIGEICDRKRTKQPKSAAQELIEYKRREYLFLVRQSSSKKRQGRQQNNYRNIFALSGIGVMNKLSAQEYHRYLREKFGAQQPQNQQAASATVLDPAALGYQLPAIGSVRDVQIRLEQSQGASAIISSGASSQQPFKFSDHIAQLSRRSKYDNRFWNDHQKFSNLQSSKILEENLNLSKCGTEVVFKVAMEVQQTWTCRYLTLDLTGRQLKIWSRHFEQFLMPKTNPYAANPSQMTQDEQRRMQYSGQSTWPKGVTMQAHDVRHVQKTKRPLKHNRWLILSISNFKSKSGQIGTEHFSFIFGSVFKLFQFLELLEQMRTNEIDTMLFQRELLFDQPLIEACHAAAMADSQSNNQQAANQNQSADNNGAPNQQVYQSDEDSEEDHIDSTTPSAEMQANQSDPSGGGQITADSATAAQRQDQAENDVIQGDIGGSHRGSYKKKAQQPSEEELAKEAEVKDFMKRFNGYLDQFICRQLNNILSKIMQNQQDMKILTITWNMARKQQMPVLDIMIPRPSDHDLIIITCQESHKRKEFIERLDKYMLSHNCSQIDNFHMWEIFIVGYCKNSQQYFFNGGTTTNKKPCGVGKMLPNKGGVQMYFNYNDMYFNFIGTHLVHGQGNRIKRDEMAEDVIKALKTERQEMDPDIVCDYNFFMGDLNYRMDNTTFEEMINTEKIKVAPLLIDQMDQLTISKRGGYHDNIYSTPKYPGYVEPKINFPPTYKRNSDDNDFKNKKNQAPSYCDRILFRNNTCYSYQFNKYECGECVFGSDHRPVSLSVSLKTSFGSQDQQHVKMQAFIDQVQKLREWEHRPENKDNIDEQIKRKINIIMNYQITGKYLNLNLAQVKQTYGVIRVKFVNVSQLKLPESIRTNLSNYTKKLGMKNQESISQHFQLSFYGDFITEFESSSEQTQRWNCATEDLDDVTWEEQNLPPIYTPINDLEILKHKRLVIILWYVDELIKDQKVIGQVNIPMSQFQRPGSLPGHQPQQRQADHPNEIPFMNLFKHDIVNANSLVGHIDLKLLYHIESTQNNLEMFKANAADAAVSNASIASGQGKAQPIAEEAKQPAN